MTDTPARARVWTLCLAALVSRDIVPSSGGLSERIDETGVRRVEVLGKAITIACG